MRNSLVTALGCGLVLAACGDDGAPRGDIPAELVATWVAEPACRPQCGFTLASVADPADSLNVTSFGGLTTELSIASNGTFRVASRPGADTISAGRARVEGSMLIVTDAAGTVDTLDYALTGAYLDLVFRREFVVLDFDGDGVLDPATARGRFRKR